MEDQLQLARIQIAQMKDGIAELTSRQDWTAREKELNERHARELYEQKMFFKGLMEEQKESHRVDMENLRKSLHEESERNIRRLEESHKREMDALRTQQASHEDFQIRHIDYLVNGHSQIVCGEVDVYSPSTSSGTAQGLPLNIIRNRILV